METRPTFCPPSLMVPTLSWDAHFSYIESEQETNKKERKKTLHNGPQVKNTGANSFKEKKSQYSSVVTSNKLLWALKEFNLRGLGPVFQGLGAAPQVPSWGQDL